MGDPVFGYCIRMGFGAEGGLRALVAANVRAERGRHGWTQQHLAALLGTSQTTVSQVEAGRRALDLDDVLALCAALRVPLRRLLVGVDDVHLQVLGLP
jgi:transcriptional regulator with XRE-family HTH domain